MIRDFVVVPLVPLVPLVSIVSIVSFLPFLLSLSSQLSLTSLSSFSLSDNVTIAPTLLLPSLPFSSCQRASYPLAGTACELLFSALRRELPLTPHAQAPARKKLDNHKKRGRHIT